MTQKLSVLRACRRALKPGGRLAFFTIFTPQGVPADVWRRLRRGAPLGYRPRADHVSLLRSAGFDQIEEVDVTKQYLRVQRALFEANERHQRALRAAVGDEEFERRQDFRRGALKAIGAGALRRSLFVAERP